MIQPRLSHFNSNPLFVILLDFYVLEIYFIVSITKPSHSCFKHFISKSILTSNPTYFSRISPLHSQTRKKRNYTSVSPAYWLIPAPTFQVPTNNLGAYRELLHSPILDTTTYLISAISLSPIKNSLNLPEQGLTNTFKSLRTDSDNRRRLYTRLQESRTELEGWTVCL